LVISGILAGRPVCGILTALADVKFSDGVTTMTQTVEIDLLSDDATIRENSIKLIKKLQGREAKRERMKKLVADLSKPKTMFATAGR
jgi:hypothetical protein